MEILAAVDDEFTDQFNIANEMNQAIARSIGSAISDIQEQARNAIEEGEGLEEQHKFDEAIKAYERVPVIVRAIPDDHTKTSRQDKEDQIRLAETKIEDARLSKKRYADSLKNPVARPAASGAPAAPAAGNSRRGRRGR